MAAAWLCDWPATQSQQVTARFSGKVQHCLVGSWSCGHVVDHWMVARMGAVCGQDYWMLRTSYHVVSSDSGCMRCLATMGPTMGANFCHGLCSQFPFSQNPSSCTGPMQLKTLTLLMLLDIIIYLILWMSGFNTIKEDICGMSEGTSKRTLEEKGLKKWTLKKRHSGDPSE